MYRTAQFWIALGERAGATFIEAYLGYIIAANYMGVVEIDWLVGANIAGLATLIMVGKGLVAGLVGNGSPGITNAEMLTPKNGG